MISLLSGSTMTQIRSPGPELVLEPDCLFFPFPFLFHYIQSKYIQWLLDALLSAMARQNGHLMADTPVSPIYH